MREKRLLLKTKLISFIIVLLVLTNLGLGLPSYLLARQELEEKGRIILENAVHMAIAKIESANISVESGAVSLEDAQEEVRLFLVGSKQEDGTRLLNTPIDLGQHGYFLAYDDEGYEVMHPTLEGQNVLDVTSFGDEEIYVVREQLRVGRQGGMVDYKWLYPGSDKVGEKLSYSKYDKNWGWTVVATAYVSDFNDSVNKIMLRMMILFILSLGFGVLFATYLSNDLLRPIHRIIDSMRNTEKLGLKKVEVLHRNDELMDLVEGYNAMVESQDYHLKEIITREKKLKTLAYIDELTGLPNRNMMERYVERQLHAKESCGYLLLIDMKELKLINSIYGISYGDEMIKIFSNGLKKNKPKTKSFLARIGGKEFGFWINECDEELISEWIESTKNFWNQEYQSKRFEVRINYNLAYVENNELNENFDRILQKANIAMQYAKENELAAVKYSKKISEQIEYVSELKRCAEIGIHKDEFYPVYQEKVSTETKKVLGVEALARWESKILGFVSPGEFIPIMSKSKLIIDFTEKMIEYVLSDFKKLTHKYGRQVSVSINISPLFFVSEHFVPFILEVASRYNVPTRFIILEITEDVLIENLELVNKRVMALRQAGMKISLDDFGTGYSSLNYLQKILIDEVKIDKSFIDNVVEDKAAEKLLYSMVDVIHNFGFDTVAEGVETYDQLKIVENAGCKILQGYYYSKPERLPDE